MPTAAGIHYFQHTGGSTFRAPLVLIHGAGGDHLSWPAEVRHLPDANVYSIDLPGHGTTTGPGSQSIEGYARSVINFMDGASLGRAVFGGHGMGGAIALELALVFPERTAGIMLVSTGACLPVPKGLLEHGSHPATLPAAIHILEGKSFAPQTPGTIVEAFCTKLTKIRQTLFHGDWLACDHFNATGRLDCINTPTLVLCGKYDRLTPLHLSQTLASGIRGAALQVIEDAGHMLTLEQPKQLAKLMGFFLKTVPYTPGA